ncbi:hypothetical protein Tco_0245478 [Tanacetum coccineum]
MENTNPPPPNNRPVLPDAPRARINQELLELKTNVNNLETDDESGETPLVSPFPHSDNDSDDEEVLNELCEYENVGMLRREKAINSFDGDDLAFQFQIFYDHVNPITRRTIDQSAGGKLRDLNPEESWAILEDLALYDNESWNDPRDFAKPVKAITLPQDVPSTSDRRLIELKNQVQRLMEAHLALTQPTQVNKITTPCEICSGPHDTQNCMENPEQAFVEYASSRTDEAGGPFNGRNYRCCTNVSFGDEFVCNPDPISNDETPDFGCGDPLEDGVRCQHGTCKWCGYNLRGGFCLFCASRDGNSSIDAPNLNFFDNPSDFSYQPPQHQPETYSCELCGNDSHYGYDCPPRFPLVYEQEPSYNQNFGDNYYPQNSSSFPQQYLNCENCGGPHESFQCQPMNQNYFEPNFNYFSFDQPSQYPIDQSPPQEMSIQDMELQKQQYLEEMQSISNQIQIKDYRNKRIDIHYRRECEIKIDELKANFNKMSIEINKKKELRQREQESIIPLNENISQIPSSIVITPVLPIMEPGDSLSMGDEQLNTIPEKESDEFIKSSVEDLVPIPSESEDTSDNDGECDLPFCDDFPPLDVLRGYFMTFSNPLFDSNDDFTSSDDESLPEEDVSKENFKIYSNPYFEFDDEYISSDVNSLFNEELEDIKNKDSYVSNFDDPALLITPLSDEDECFDLGGDIDEIDAFLDIDVSTDIEDGCYDSEGDIIYLESLHISDTIPNLPPKDCPDYEDSRARGFVHRSLDLQSFACLNMGIRYPRSY